MSLNRTARGIVLVPTLLLGSAFLSAAAWLKGEAAANRPLALVLGVLLLAVALVSQLIPEPPPSHPSNDAEGG